VFEMSPDRADFIATLFSKPRPAGLGADTPIQKIWEAFGPAATDREAGAKTYARIVERLTKTQGFTLGPDELGQLDLVFQAFLSIGPAITTRGSGGGGGGNTSTFADLTGWMTDDKGEVQSFLSTEDNYRAVKALHDKNLIVPVSGDFAGPKTIRAIGTYLKERQATVTAFYLSNVESYLFQDGKQAAFIENASKLPITPASVFIRPYSMRQGLSRPLCPIGAFVETFNAGRIFGNSQALSCGQ
jgi:hypothetical protein